MAASSTLGPREHDSNLQPDGVSIGREAAFRPCFRSRRHAWPLAFGALVFVAVFGWVSAVFARDGARQAVDRDGFHKQLLGEGNDRDTWEDAVLQLRPYHQKPDTAPDWLFGELTKLFQAEAVKDTPRTEYIWSSLILRGSALGAQLLVSLWLDDTVPAAIHTRCLDALNDPDADRHYAEAAFAELARTERVEDFEKLFPVLADLSIRRALAVTIARLPTGDATSESLPKETLFAALENALVIRFASAKEWQDWWQVHGSQPLMPGIRERQRTRVEDQAVARWQQATEHLAAQRSFEAWLLGSLDAGQPARIRKRALKEVANHSFRLAAETATADERRQRLRPLFDRCIELATSPQSRALSLDKLALDALAQMKDFRDDDALMTLIRSAIERLPSEPGQPDYARGVAAVKTAAELGAAVTAPLEALCSRMVPEGVDWSKLDQDLFVTLLDAFRKITPSPATLTTLKRVYLEAKNDTIHAATLPVFKNAGPKLALEDKPIVLDFFLTVVKSREPAHLKAAILGIPGIGLGPQLRTAMAATGGLVELGKLAVEAAVPIEARVAALNTLADVGGRAAALELRAMLGQPFDESQLATAHWAALTKTSVDDPSLGVLDTLLASGDAPAGLAWFERLISDPAIDKQLRYAPGAWTFVPPSTDRKPELFKRWYRIELHIVETLLTLAPTEATLVREAEVYGRAQRLATMALQAVKEDVPHEFPRARLSRLATTAQARSTLIAQLQQAKFEEGARAAVDLVKVADEAERNKELRWALGRLRGLTWSEAEKGYLARIREIVAQESVLEIDAKSKALIEQLERRGAEAVDKGAPKLQHHVSSGR